MTAGELQARPGALGKPQSGAARRDYWDTALGPLAGSAVQRRLASDLPISLQQSPMDLLQPSMRTISQPAAQRIGPLAGQEPYDPGTKVRQISDLSASTAASAANRARMEAAAGRGVTAIKKPRSMAGQARIRLANEMRGKM